MFRDQRNAIINSEKKARKFWAQGNAIIHSEKKARVFRAKGMPSFTQKKGKGVQGPGERHHSL